MRRREPPWEGGVRGLALPRSWEHAWFILKLYTPDGLEEDVVLADDVDIEAGYQMTEMFERRKRMIYRHEINKILGIVSDDHLVEEFLRED